jgi:hypothetical protein
MWYAFLTPAHWLTGVIRKVEDRKFMTADSSRPGTEKYCFDFVHKKELVS